MIVLIQATMKWQNLSFGNCSKTSRRLEIPDFRQADFDLFEWKSCLPVLGSSKTRAPPQGWWFGSHRWPSTTQAGCCTAETEHSLSRASRTGIMTARDTFNAPVIMGEADAASEVQNKMVAKKNDSSSTAGWGFIYNTASYVHAGRGLAS